MLICVGFWNDSPTQNDPTRDFLRVHNRFSGSHVNKTYYERESNNELISEQMILKIIRQKPNYSGFYFDKSANRYSHTILSFIQSLISSDKKFHNFWAKIPIFPQKFENLSLCRSKRDIFHFILNVFEPDFHMTCSKSRIFSQTIFIQIGILSHSNIFPSKVPEI